MRSAAGSMHSRRRSMRTAVALGTMKLYGIANFDSASAMLRATARFLGRKDFPALGQPRFLEAIVPLSERLPRNLRTSVFAASAGGEGIARRLIGRVSTAAIAQWTTRLYPPRPYPAVMIGSSSGALVHLCAALGVPWLPQTFMTPVRQSEADPDDPRHGLETAREAALRLLAGNPDVQLHQMHDPNQDRLPLRFITYFRWKYRRLPPAYRDFLERRLEPGGTIFVVECQRRWPTTRVDDRYVIQFGALGGATPEDYFQGSERTEDYLRRYGSPLRRWDPPSPDGESPEAEWGFEPALREEIEQLAHRHRLRVVRVLFEEPEHLSPLVSDLYRWWYRRRGLPANRLLGESFILLEPHWALRTGSVPFWMKFNMEPSADWLRRYLDHSEKFDHLHLMLFSHGLESIGLVPIEGWREILRQARRSASFIGTNEALFPSDFGTLTRYNREMRSIPSRYPLPGPLTLKQFQDILGEIGTEHLVRFTELAA
ncbi:hypothetical protein KXR53_32135 [Inquilinus limosus]|uniref:hypothetical protein n=1 Tax=Inquilinus limosus TaxID=171674 RepID=UPI003F165C8D